MTSGRVRDAVHGIAWAAGLASFAWAGLGLTEVQGAPRSGHGTVAASPVVTTAPPSGLRVEGGPNADGWYAAPARYHWVAQDLGGGITSCQGGSVVAVDSAVPRTVYGTCVDDAGRPASYVGFSYRYDGTPPTLDPVAVPAVVPRHGVVVAQPRATDALSGVARQGCNGGRAPNTRRLGLHTVTCFVLDRAGNVATASASYLVVDRRLRQG
ncbi:hypothetical protein [Terrabacter sp. Ter38]|uniref:hypothetical protein n=1 Tax=Terrabacter sp. Ter38 TaxID=2926030 RepID=UPI002118ED68|nr:hypothetical protein [Terrabacter sp. Ter38]